MKSCGVRSRSGFGRYRRGVSGRAHRSQRRRWKGEERCWRSGCRSGSKQWLQQGREQGLEQGLERGLEQGLEQGREQGLERGRAEERALLCRQASRRFGAETGERLSGLLARLTDPERLAEVGDQVIECGTGAELLDRAGRLARLS